MTGLSIKIDEAHEYLHTNHEAYKANSKEMAEIQSRVTLGRPMTEEESKRVYELNFTNRNLIIDYLQSLYD